MGDLLDLLLVGALLETAVRAVAPTAGPAVCSGGGPGSSRCCVRAAVRAGRAGRAGALAEGRQRPPRSRPGKGGPGPPRPPRAPVVGARPARGGTVHFLFPC